LKSIFQKKLLYLSCFAFKNLAVKFPPITQLSYSSAESFASGQNSIFVYSINSTQPHGHCLPTFSSRQCYKTFETVYFCVKFAFVRCLLRDRFALGLSI